MAPKSDNYIWIALGIGGLYLLTRTDDKKKEKVEIVIHHDSTFGSGMVGGGRKTAGGNGRP